MLEWAYVRTIKTDLEFLRLVYVSVCRTSSKTRTYEQLDNKWTYGQTPGIEFGAFQLKMWQLVASEYSLTPHPTQYRSFRRRRQLVAIILMIFLIIKRPTFVYLLVDPGILSAPLNLYEASRLVPHRMDAPGRHNRQSDVSVCLLDGVCTASGKCSVIREPLIHSRQ